MSGWGVVIGLVVMAGLVVWVGLVSAKAATKAGEVDRERHLREDRERELRGRQAADKVRRKGDEDLAAVDRFWGVVRGLLRRKPDQDDHAS